MAQEVAMTYDERSERYSQSMREYSVVVVVRYVGLSMLYCMGVCGCRCSSSGVGPLVTIRPAHSAQPHIPSLSLFLLVHFQLYRIVSSLLSTNCNF